MEVAGTRRERVLTKTFNRRSQRTLVRGKDAAAAIYSNEVTRMTFRPLHDRVLVRRVEAEEKTAGGIIIPDTAKEKPQEGEVISVGSGTRGEDGSVTPLDVKAGDKILFGKWSGTEVRLDGEDLLIMKESDILGIVEESLRPEGRPDQDCHSSAEQE